MARREDVVIMLVVEVRRFGGPEVLTAGQAPDPVAGPGQVVVRTAAADVLFIDTAIRSGRGVDFFAIRPPYVPGNGVSGQVISAGDGVDADWIGRPVAIHTGTAGGSGGYAEQVAAAAADLIPVPDGLGLPEAAALLHDGATAMGLAATAHVVFDGAGGQLCRAAFGVTAPGGRFSAHGMSAGGFASVDAEEARRREVTLNGIGAYRPEVFRRHAAAALAAATGADRIRPVIGQRFPLARAADAHAALQARTAIAKTLLFP